MSSLPDDDRLTAYALGELDPADAAEIEARLADDPEAVALVAEIRSTADLLAGHLRDEIAPTLAPAQVPTIEDRIRPIPIPRRRRWAEFAIAAGLLALAATLAFPAVRDHFNPDRPLAFALNQAAPAKAEEPAAGSAAGARIQPADGPEAMPAPGGELAVAASPMAPTPVENPSAAPLPVARFGRSGTANPPLPRAPRPIETRSPATREQQGPGQAPQEAGQSGDDFPPPSGKYFNDDVKYIPADAAAAGQAKDLQARAQISRMKTSMSPGGRPGPDLDRRDVSRTRRDKGVEPDLAKDAFAPIEDNPFRPVDTDEPSTFSIDCDTASYSSVRKFLNRGVLPPRDAVRIEELINYFPYAYPDPKGSDPFSIDVEVARCPWDAGHRLVRVGLKGREIEQGHRPPSNLVFLIDVSGSMNEIDKLPLLKAGMKLLVEALGENDRVAIVVYASSEGLALDSTSCSRKAEILSALDQLRPQGGTDGGRGINLAYDVAVRNFIPGGTNRVILATDGDFNIGVTEGPELDRLIDAKRATGVFLSVLGFGEGNVKHDRLERLADRGNGQYCFIDSINEARKVLVDQMGGTLVTIAKDVKIQVKFNPEQVSTYRQIGYENRQLRARDFNDDRKDAGEIGAGHSVTALYEVVPPGQGGVALAKSDTERIIGKSPEPASKARPLLEVDVRCKAPDGDVSRLFPCPATDTGKDFAAASPDFRFASAVAGFGMLLRDSPYKGTLTWPGLIELTSGTLGTDLAGYRKEFLELVRKAQAAPAR